MLNYYIDLSERILTKAKLEEDSTTLRKELYYISISSLERKINTDELKRIFWVNIYNAYVLIMKKEQTKPKLFFKLNRIKISHYLLSLNDIKYGILRVKKFEIGFYKIYNPFYSTFIKNLAVNKIDNSINQSLDKINLSNTPEVEKNEFNLF
ncbi:DUF547 domain-containing protein [Flavobacterium sp.]|uniref:DUF547 domain-containing protein n=1 Tax=Flavobacterium sp. TaxID=239 RepID=UPI00286CB49C|nr:DUF547 domain-containing protein [Flavobacterium sp.]